MDKKQQSKIERGHLTVEVFSGAEYSGGGRVTDLEYDGKICGPWLRWRYLDLRK